jgi:catechol 2,3-dioxygenase-like lactoylglutathione lyase family enzyme
VNVRHYGLACRSEQTADRFYEKFLGLKKSEPKTVPAALGEAFFGLPRDLAVMSYAGDGVSFEVFIQEREPSAARSPNHICLEVPNLETFLERCRSMDVPVIRAPRGEQWITFIRDFDGNLFEIKEAKP